MRMRARAVDAAWRGRARAGWLGALAMTGLMALPTLSAPVAQASGMLAPTLFQAPVAYSASSDSVGVATGDLNGDGITDLVIGNEYGNDIQVRLGNADGTFQPTRSYAYADDSWYLVEPVIADFNGDGYPDVAVASDEYDMVFVFLNDGHGRFTPDTTITGAADSGEAWGIAAADVNNDGKMDVLFTEYSANQVDVALGVGDGTFHTARGYATGEEPGAIAVGDFNGDGMPDMAVTTFDDDVVSLLLNTGHGYFHASASIAVGSDSYGVVAADFTNDGKTDLAVATSEDGLQFFKGKGNGTFYTAKTYNPRFPAEGDYALAKGDFNGDGKLDLAVTSDDSDGYVDVFSGNGTGSFAFAGTSHPEGDIYDIAAADFNGDGKTDIVTSTDDYYVHVLLSAQPPTTSVAVGSPSKVRPGVTYVTNATPITVSIAATSDGAKTLAWRLYPAGTLPPLYLTANSTSQNLSLHSLPVGKYVLEFYGISDHGLSGAVQTVNLTLGNSIP